MASREEEKRLRREERERLEAATAASAARSKRLQFLLGALLTVAVVVGAVLLVTGRSGNDGTSAGTPSASAEGEPIPPPKERDLAKAAEAANCTVESPEPAGANHVEGQVDYATNPPTSGNHSATPALDGIYTPDTSPEAENWVHSLEHGRVVISYRPGTDPKLIAQLETLASEPLNGIDAYKVLLVQYADLDYAVAASAWGQLIGCKQPSDAMFDALRDFRVQYVDKGPETGIPPTNA